MQVFVESCLDTLLEKYKDPTGERQFNFYLNYANSRNFNKAVNLGLKLIGAELNIEKLEFYAARHSWATIARSNKVDKSTVHEALNHVEDNMKVTDIYINKDWSVIWDANKIVLDLFDWSSVGYDVL